MVAVQNLKIIKTFCFGGILKFIQMDFDCFTNHCQNIYDVNWNKLYMKLLYPTDENANMQKLICLEKCWK